MKGEKTQFSGGLMLFVPFYRMLEGFKGNFVLGFKKGFSC